MKAFKCDRCKKYYDYYPYVTINKANKGYNAIKTIFVSENNQATMYSRDYELCQECMIKLIEFLEGDETTDEH